MLRPNFQTVSYYMYTEERFVLLTTIWPGNERVYFRSASRKNEKEQLCDILEEKLAKFLQEVA